MPQAQVMMRSWRSAIKVHRTAAQYIFKLHTSGMERCMQTCFLHTRLSAMSLAPQHTCSATERNRGRTSIRQGMRQPAMSLQTCSRCGI